MRDLGAEWVSLDVLTTNSPARMLYERLGFKDVQMRMAAPLATLEQRAGGGAAVESSLALVHVQTDDQAAIVAAVERFVPRLYRSAATVVTGAAKRLGLGQRRSVGGRAAPGPASSRTSSRR